MKLPIIVGIAVLVLITAVRITIFAAEVKSEIKYLNSEIERCSGRERKYYKKHKKRLLLSFLPFIRYK